MMQMNKGDNMLPDYRERQFRRDIDLYINTRYAGFQRIETIEEYFEDYKFSAEEMAESVNWNSVVLYAIFEYDIEDQSFISANFMLLEMPYDIYAELLEKFPEGNRFFFVRGRKENYEY